MKRFYRDILKSEKHHGFKDIIARRLYNQLLTAGGKRPKKMADESNQDYMVRLQEYNRQRAQIFLDSDSEDSSDSDSEDSSDDDSEDDVREILGECPICRDVMYEGVGVLPLHPYLRCTKCYGAQWIEDGGGLTECDCNMHRNTSAMHYGHVACLGPWFQEFQHKSDDPTCPYCREPVDGVFVEGVEGNDGGQYEVRPPTMDIGFQRRNYRMLRSLIEDNPNLAQVQDDNDDTPLHRLLREGFDQAEEGLNPQQKRYAQQGRATFLRDLIPRSDLSAQNADGNTPLHILFGLGFTDRIVNLFNLGARNLDTVVGLRNNDGETILDLDKGNYLRTLKRRKRKRERQQREGVSGSGDGASSSTPISPVMDLTLFQDDTLQTMYEPHVQDKEKEAILQQVHDRFRKKLRKRRRQLINEHAGDEDFDESVLENDNEFNSILAAKKKEEEDAVILLEQRREYQKASEVDRERGRERGRKRGRKREAREEQDRKRQHLVESQTRGAYEEEQQNKKRDLIDGKIVEIKQLAGSHTLTRAVANGLIQDVLELRSAPMHRVNDELQRIQGVIDRANQGGGGGGQRHSNGW